MKIVTMNIFLKGMKLFLHDCRNVYDLTNDQPLVIWPHFVLGCMLTTIVCDNKNQATRKIKLAHTTCNMLLKAPSLQAQIIQRIKCSEILQGLRLFRFCGLILRSPLYSISTTGPQTWVPNSRAIPYLQDNLMSWSTPIVGSPTGAIAIAIWTTWISHIGTSIHHSVTLTTYT